MNAALEVQAGPKLAYRKYLTDNRDAMVALLVSEYQMPPGRAAEMVDSYWDFTVAAVVKEHKDDDLWAPALAGFVPDLTGEAADTALATLVVNEAVGFLAVSADNAGFGPSLMVDWGWHELMGPSMVYAVFTTTAFGRVLHHEPEGLVTTPTYEFGWPTFHLDDTVAAMRARGPVAELLWLTSGKCGNPCDGCCNMRCQRI